MNSEQVRGLYLVPPHGELIAAGAKSAVVKSKYIPGHRLFDLRGDWMLVSKVGGVGLGLGDVTLGEPVEVSLDVFDTKEAEHRVERVDRMRWWPEYETLWVYPIEGFKGYDESLAVDVPAGVQTVMSNMEFQAEDEKALTDVTDGHFHALDSLDFQGSGSTEVSQNHYHEVQNFEVQETIDHSHLISEKTRDLFAAAAQQSRAGARRKDGDTKHLPTGSGSPATVDTTDTSIKARPSRSQCMECKSPPVIDVHWADGRGRAWFCLKHFKEWIEDDDREIVRAFYLSDGEAPVKIGEGEQVLKLRERLSQEALVERIESLIVKEEEKAYSSVAIALSIPPPVAKKLAVEGTAYEGDEGQGVIPADQLHLTLAYLGDAKELEKQQELLQGGIAAFAAGNQEVSGEVKGRIVFDTPNGSAVCAHFDSPELPDFRQRLVTFLNNLGFEAGEDHGFTPHICLAYVDPRQEAGIETPTIPDVTLGELSVLWAGDRTDYQLKGTEIKETTDMQEITVLLDDEQLESEDVKGNPYSKLSEANPAIRGIDPPVTLMQANTIASWADAMEAAEDGPESPWGAAIAQFKELYEVNEANEAGDGWTKRSASGSKAKWSSTYISSLPDTAFLLIESGGEKKDGITRPLSLRHLPVRGKDGEVDPSHLRNALARMSQIKDKEGKSFPAATIDKLREKARKLLAESQKVRGEGQGVGKPRQGDTGTGYCICPECDYIVEHERGTPCNEVECEKCGELMRGATQAEIETAGIQADRAVVAAVATGVDASVKEGRRVRQDKVGLLQKLKDELNEFLVSLGEFIGWATYDDKPADEAPEEFDLGTLLSVAGKKALARGSTAFAFKALDGQTWWFQWTTNAFKDREGEIFTTKAISDFVDRRENEDIKGEFWFWHTPGSKFGTVRLQAIVGRFLAQAGPFDDTAVGRAFKEFFSEYPHSHPTIAPEGWGTSHGYSFNSKDREDSVYDWFVINESTVLPARYASNPYSPMPQILQEVKMNKQQRDAFATVGGEEFVNLILNIGEGSTKKLEDEVDFKEVTPNQDDKAGGNYVARIKEIAKGIKDDSLRGQVEVFCAKLEEATPAAEKEGEGEDEKAKTDVASLAGQLRMLAGKVGGDAGEKLSAIAEEMAQASGKKEDAETTTEAEAEKTVEPKPEVDVLTREEVADAMKAIVGVLRDEIKEIAVVTVTEVTEALKPLVAEVKSLKEADEVKVAQKAAETPAASLSSLLQSVIGSKATVVDVDSPLAQSGPKETPPDAANVTGIPFVDTFIGGTDQASQKPTAGGN